MDNCNASTDTPGLVIVADSASPALDITAGDFRLVFDSRGLRVTRISDDAPLLVVTSSTSTIA